MAQVYLLEWLDLLITVTLNPVKTDVRAITDEQASAVIEKTREQASYIQSRLKHHIFSLRREKQIKLVIGNYHSALIVLLDHALELQKHESFDRKDLREMVSALLSCLDELLFFLETRFSGYLSLDERVPFNYLVVSKKELRRKIDKIRPQLTSDSDNLPLTQIVLDNLYTFIKSRKNRHITFREVLYRKELVKELQLLKAPYRESGIYNTLNELLIYLNFNAKAYISYLTRHIAGKINALESPLRKMESLLLYSKELKQIYTKEGIILNPHHKGIKAALKSWFSHEIIYLEKQQHIAVMPLPLQDKKQQKTEDRAKVRLKLSSDQTALLLRAADELQIVMARSMREVFKTIVPYLSTPHKKELSYDAMRSKSYNAEERDKKIVIGELERMIRKIKDY